MVPIHHPAVRRAMPCHAEGRAVPCRAEGRAESCRDCAGTVPWLGVRFFIPSPRRSAVWGAVVP
eukprot:1752634-Pyramimonas_sp.AAC.1